MRIFISYRRADSSGYAGRIYDSLTGAFNSKNIFMDVTTIRPGENFVEVINNQVSSCDVLLALIGKRWLAETDEQGERRLDDPHDFVRLEIATALESGVDVIPVLVGGATMPRAGDLPEALAGLATTQALSVSDERFHYDMERLTKGIRAQGGRMTQPSRIPRVLVLAAAGLLVAVIAVGGVLMADGLLSNQPATNNLPDQQAESNGVGVAFAADFEDSSLDGTLDQNTWLMWEDQSGSCDVYQHEGALRFDLATLTTGNGCFLGTRTFEGVPLEALSYFEAKIMLASDHSGGLVTQAVNLLTFDMPGGYWEATCGLEATETGIYGLTLVKNYGSGAEADINRHSFALDYDTWYTVRLAVNPDSAEFTCAVDGQIIGTVVPDDVLALRSAKFDRNIKAYRSAGAFVTAYVDDVVMSEER